MLGIRVNSNNKLNDFPLNLIWKMEEPNKLLRHHSSYVEM